MEQASEPFSGEHLANGLQAADAAVLEHLYVRCKPAVIKTITRAGGSHADGNVFFQLALLEAFRLLRAGYEPGDIPFERLLQHLALAHFQDWRAERGQVVPETVLQEFDEQECTLPELSPAQSAATRQSVSALKRLELQPGSARKLLRLHFTEGKSVDEMAQQLGRPAESVASGLQAAITEFNQVLRQAGDTAAPDALPDWAAATLQDAGLCTMWEALRQTERRQDAEPAAGRSTLSNRTIRLAFAALLLLTVGYFAFRTWFGPKPPAEVYKENFDPPKSMVEDIARRYGAAMGNDSVTTQPGECTLQFQEADFLYKEGHFDAVRDILFPIAENPDTYCQSDAWFYLGIIALRQDEPGLAIEFFSKIEDLTSFGEDIYWYQSLAFVKAAARNPLLKERSARAVERALGNIIDPERKKKAEEMLRELQQ